MIRPYAKGRTNTNRMRLLTFKNLPYLALALVEAYVLTQAIWYFVKEGFNQETDVMIAQGCMIVYFLIPSFLSRSLRKYKILWTKVLSFSILSGLISAVLLLLYSVSCVSGIYYFDSLSDSSSFWDYFWGVSFCFWLLTGVVHFLIGSWSILGFISELITICQRKTVEHEKEGVK